jgi:tRNA uridine 5-carbamoylmethylation protein Kti12
MSTSPTRRQKRFEERQSKKLFQKISQQTLEQINKQSPEEKDRLLKLYQHMLEEKTNKKQETE